VIVVCGYGLNTAAFDPINQGKESFAAFQLASADIKVAEDLDLHAGCHRRQSTALLLLYFRGDCALAFLVARLPDVDESDAYGSRRSRGLHRSTLQHGLRWLSRQ
jgi:hypothetical protein